MAERVQQVVDSRELERSFLEDIFTEAQKMRQLPLVFSSEKRRAYLSFHLPSNITKSSFVAAISRLDWPTPFIRDIPSQSMWPTDSEYNVDQEVRIANLQDYGVIILRSPKMGGAKRAARVSQVPVINAGEGFDGVKLLDFSQHTSQGIADAATIYHRLGYLDGLRITVIGDTRDNPVTNSLLCTLASFRVEVTLGAPFGPRRLHQEVEEFLLSRGVGLKRVEVIREVLPTTDVLYIAHSRHVNRTALKTHLDPITPAELDLLPSHAMVMHDLTKGILPEVSSEVHSDSRLIHELQIEHGVYVNMALLKAVVSP